MKKNINFEYITKKHMIQYIFSHYYVLGILNKSYIPSNILSMLLKKSIKHFIIKFSKET